MAAFAIYTSAAAQRPFTEGTITYHVVLNAAAHKEFNGTYTFTFKGMQVKKELKLNNGYEDVVLYNTGANTVYSLQNKYGRKYAIQLSMEEYLEKQEKFSGFTIAEEVEDGKAIAGYATKEGEVHYRNGTKTKIRYTAQWYAPSVTFERFPNAKLLPLHFSYKDEHGLDMQFEATKIEAGPMENSAFRIPGDYKIISYNEYKELSK